MILKSLFFSSLAATVAVASAVIDLTPSNFDEVVLKSGKPTLVEFFAPWCGHCKNLAPVYEELATTFQFARDRVQIAKVDAEAEKSLSRRFGVQGFPTLKWFDGQSDTPTDYNSGRDLQSLSGFVADNSGVRIKKKLELPSDVVVLNDATFAQEVGGDKHVLVAFTAPWCGHCKNLAPVWEKLATDYASDDSVLIAKLDAEAEDSKATAKAQDVNSYPTIKWFPKGSPVAEPYDGMRAEQDFLDWINGKVGLHRTIGGGLTERAGVIPSVDSAIASLRAGARAAAGAVTGTELAAQVKKDLEGIAGDVQYKAVDYYVRVFEKLAKSDNYVAKELARLDGILAKGGLAPSKRDEFQVKTNILKRFATKMSETVQDVEEKVDETVQDVKEKVGETVEEAKVEL